jgi:hypothetical protein
VPKRPKNSPPATKADIKLLMSSIGRLYDANERWKDEVKQHFDVAVETIRHELVSANRDKVQALVDRVSRLERHTGLAVA